MGNLIWHKYSRLVSITSSVYAIWASLWGCFYRKFFWDFIGGTLQNPGGIQPSPNVASFIAIIVDVPAIQILTMLLAAINLCIELPLPLFKTLSLYRSLSLRVVLLIFQASSAILFYQGTNAALWSLISAICYMRAIALGERIQEAEGFQGKGEPWFLFSSLGFGLFVIVLWWRRISLLRSGRPTFLPSYTHFQFLNFLSFWFRNITLFEWTSRDVASPSKFIQMGSDFIGWALSTRSAIASGYTSL